MLTERLQVLVSREQRRRLDEESRRTGSSVGALVREAIDARLGAAAVDERVKAVERIAATSGTYLPPDELDALIGDERLRPATAQ